MPNLVRCGDIFIPGPEPPSFVYIAASALSSIGASSTSDSQVAIFDASTCQILTTIKAHDEMINGIDINDCSQLLITCCEHGDGASGNEVSLWDLRSITDHPICTYSVASHVHYAKNCRCVSSSKNGLIVGAGTDAGIVAWDVRKPECAFRHVNLQPSEIASIQFHPFATGTFLAGDDDGNLLLYDLDAGDDEQGNLFYSNDQNPVMQCGFCGVDTVFTLRRTAGIRLWNIMDPAKDVCYEDLRELTDHSFGYPIDAHWCGDWLMTVGGDSEGGVAIVMCCETSVKLLKKEPNAHRECVNASYLDLQPNGEIHLYLGGDAGQLSVWKITPE